MVCGFDDLNSVTMVGDEDDTWEVFFCLDAWDFFYERLAVPFLQ